MSTARIENDSVSILLLSYALAGTKVVWLETVPQHIKAIGAIWASLITGHKVTLVTDEEPSRSIIVEGIGGRYERFESDSPNLAGRNNSRPKFIRLVAPNALRIDDPAKGFVVLNTWGLPPGQIMAGLLEKHTSLPMCLGWGDYLLAAAVEAGFARPLLTGVEKPVTGYAFSGETPWRAMVEHGLKIGAINLDGETVAIPTDWPSFEPVKKVATHA